MSPAWPHSPKLSLTAATSNKWVLNTTDVPLFFLDMQLVIAVILFLFAHMLGMLQLPLRWDWQVIKGLIPTVSLSLIGLRCVPARIAV